jgi:hypothetical protein
MAASLAEYSLLVVQSFNDGTAVSPSLRQQIESLLLDRFDGFTAQRNLEGCWRDANGQVFPDRVDDYRVAASAASRVLAVAREIGVLLK